MATMTAFDQVGKKEDVSDIITNISPTQTPLQTMIGREGAWNIVVQWQEDSLLSPAANAQVEGFSAITAAWQPTVMRSNTTQIFSKTAQTSGTTDAIRTYGRSQEMAYQLGMRSKELKRDLEFALVGTVQAQNLGNTSTARVMANFPAMITSGTDIPAGYGVPVVFNNVATSHASQTTAVNLPLITGQYTTGTTAATPVSLSESMVTTVAQQLFSNGVDPSVLMINPNAALSVAGFVGTAGPHGAARQRLLDGGSKTLVNVIDTYVSPFGDLRVVMNRFQRASEAYVFDPEMLKLYTLRNWFRETLGIVGDFRQIMVTGEFSLKHRNFAASGMITGLVTTAGG